MVADRNFKSFSHKNKYLLIKIEWSFKKNHAEGKMRSNRFKASLKCLIFTKFVRKKYVIISRLYDLFLAYTSFWRLFSMFGVYLAKVSGRFVPIRFLSLYRRLKLGLEAILGGFFVIFYMIAT